MMEIMVIVVVNYVNVFLEHVIKMQRT